MASKRVKTLASKFVDIAATVASSDEEEEEDDYEHERGQEQAAYSSEESEYDDEDEGIYSAVLPVSSGIEALCDGLASKYVRPGARPITEGAQPTPSTSDPSSSIQRIASESRLPSVDDCRLYSVKVKAGREKDIVFGVANKVFFSEVKEHLSIFFIPKTPGRVYFESESGDAIRRLCRGMTGVFWRTVALVPVEDRVPILRVDQQKQNISVNSWVRIRSGLYKDDVGFVVSADDLKAPQNFIVKVVPRVDLRKSTLGKRKKERVLAQLFDARAVRDVYGEDSVSLTEGRYVFHKNAYSLDGFRLLEVSYHSLVEGKPTADESKVFHEADDNMKPPPMSLHPHFHRGNRVRIIAGGYRNSSGVLDHEPEGDKVSVRLLDREGLDVDDSLQAIEVSLGDIERVFNIGEEVVVTTGMHVGSNGMIVLVDQASITISVRKGGWKCDEIILPSAYVDSFKVDVSKTQSQPIAKDAAAEAGDVDRLALEFRDCMVYVLHGEKKGRFGRVISMGPELALLSIDSVIMGQGNFYIKREFLLSETMRTLLTGAPPNDFEARKSDYRRLFRDMRSDNTVRPKTPPAMEADVLSTHPPTRLLDFHHNREAEGMWVFDARIAEVRKSYHLVMAIHDHPKPENLGLEAKVIQQSHPQTHPLPSDCDSVVPVQFKDKHSKVRNESIPVRNLRPKNNKTGGKRVVIRGERTGEIVEHIKNHGSIARVYIEREDGKKDRFKVDYNDLCIIEKV